MGRKNTCELGEDSLLVRTEMKRLMQEENLSEGQALKRVLPDDKNRKQKLQTWIRHGLWDPASYAKEHPAIPHKAIKNIPTLTPDMLERLVSAANRLAELEEIKFREPTYRPKFKGKRRSTSVRLPVLLEQAAMVKARKNGDANLTGDTLGGLLDLLLWRYLDCDEKFLGGPDE